MKLKLAALGLTFALAVPTLAFAQSTQTQDHLTRAEVRAQLVELEQAGWDPQDDRLNYPESLQAAEARVAAKHAAAQASHAANSNAPAQATVAE
ncbi:MAG TPA: DUF4148 domain-containing protein [Pararobbsia sp.]|jgi:hypothetical protein|nr:DUF4148 domain-containing protein [Pararobbsia sp.]